MKKIVCFLLVITVVFGCSFFLVSCDNQPIDQCFIDVEYENGVAFGWVEYCIKTKKSLKEVAFNLYANAFNDDSGGIVIKNVVANTGQCFWQELGESKQFLTVKFKNKVKKGKSVKIRIEFSTALIGGESFCSKTQSVVNLAYFYPNLCAYDKQYLLLPYVDFGNSFNGDFFDITVRLTLPSIMSVACGGVAEGVALNQEKTTYLYSLPRAKSFACSLYENYQIISKKWGNKRINYYYYDEINPQKTVETIIKAFEFACNFFNYPYEIFTLAKTPCDRSGRGYSAYCAVNENQNESDYMRSVICQVFNQYLPQSFNFNEYFIFFGDGLVEYLTYSFLEKENLAFKEARANYYKKLISDYENENYVANDRLRAVKKLSDFKNEQEYFIIACAKSYLAFYQIEKSGVDIFKALKKLYNDKAFLKVDEKTFVKAFGKDQNKVKKIFNEFVNSDSFNA